MAALSLERYFSLLGKFGMFVVVVFQLLPLTAVYLVTNYRGKIWRVTGRRQKLPENLKIAPLIPITQSRAVAPKVLRRAVYMLYHKLRRNNVDWKHGDMGV